MSVNASKRQKKLEKQKAKKKAERKEIARRQSQGMPGRLQAAAAAPILHCCHTGSLWEGGIGNVLVSRELPSGNVAFAMFLLDVYCLGVKDLVYDVLSRAAYETKVYEYLRKQGPVKHIKPEAARKLVEGGVDYAMQFDLPPHPDYRVGKLIFGDISADACTDEFEYGRNGKPYFFAGPNDDAARCRVIHNALQQTCGPDGFDFVIPVVGPDGLAAFAAPDGSFEPKQIGYDEE